MRVYFALNNISSILCLRTLITILLKMLETTCKTNMMQLCLNISPQCVCGEA